MNPEALAAAAAGGRRGAGVLPMGLEAPAYVADTPHDLVLAMQTGAKFHSTRTAAELEGWLREAWELDRIVERPLEERERFDQGGRLLALWILEHWTRYPSDVDVGPRATLRQMQTDHPRLPELLDSTARQVWAFAAARRLIDAHRIDG
jgi:hypothetical protein